jgi:hypothetical protein
MQVHAPQTTHLTKKVDYKAVMKEYGLGPNGGILTAANLFATRFDQVGPGAKKRAVNVHNMFARGAAPSNNPPSYSPRHTHITRDNQIQTCQIHQIQQRSLRCARSHATLH